MPAGTLLDRYLKSVVLADRLRTHLLAKALDEAIAADHNPDGVTLDQRNMNLQQMLTRGYELKCEVDGQTATSTPVSSTGTGPEDNDLLVINQLTVESHIHPPARKRDWRRRDDVRGDGATTGLVRTSSLAFPRA